MNESPVDGAASVDLAWSDDEVVGYPDSTSFATRSIFGDRVEAFAGELRTALSDVKPDGRFPRRLGAR